MKRITLMMVLGVLGFLAGCSLAPNEEEIRRRIRSELDAAGLTWVEIEVEGRSVRLAGFPPRLGVGGDAVRTTRATECRTVVGTVPCATEVSADFGTSLAQPEAWPSIEASVAAGVLTVRGTVPDASSRDAVIDAASSGIAGGRIEGYEEHLDVIGLAPRAGSDALMRRVVRALSYCSEGSAGIEEGRVSMNCRVHARQSATVRQILASPLPAGELTALELSLPAEAERETTSAR